MSAPAHSDVAPYPKGKFHNGRFIGYRRLECADSDIAAILDYYDTPPNDTWPYNFGGWSQTACLVGADVYPKPGIAVTSSTSPLIDYDKAWIDLVYDTGEMFSLSGYRIWEEVFPGVGVQSHGRPNFYWADNTPYRHGDGGIAHRYALGTYKLAHYKLAAVPYSVLATWGKVNATNYNTATFGAPMIFPAGTMLCTGAYVSRGSPGTATRSWKQAIYKFQINGGGWNLVFRPDKNQYEPIYLPDGTQFLPQGTSTFTWTSLAI